MLIYELLYIDSDTLFFFRTLFECKNYDKLDFEPLKKLKYLTVL